eukprot:3123864-Rhodomonas_salina.2
MVRVTHSVPKFVPNGLGKWHTHEAGLNSRIRCTGTALGSFASERGDSHSESGDMKRMGEKLTKGWRGLADIYYQTAELSKKFTKGSNGAKETWDGTVEGAG